MTVDTHAVPSERFELLLAIRMDIGTFASDWAYCDRVSTYVARMVSHNRSDSLLYSNLLSSALNELLETVHRTHGSVGEFACSILRSGPRERIELTIPKSEAEADFYGDAIGTIASGDLAERYRASLFRDGPIDPTIGLMELAVDYDARLTVEALGDGAVRLAAELTLEEPAQ